MFKSSFLKLLLVIENLTIYYDDLVFYVQHYFSHIEMMEGWWWKVLCKEAPYSHELIS